MEKAKEVEFFDGFVAAHGQYDVLGRGAYRRLLALFNAMVKPRPGERCLDLGCGTGAFTRQLLTFKLDLTGVDISPQSIALAQAAATSETYRVGDIAALDLPDAQADIAVFSGVLHHCPEPSTRIAILREAHRLLKPGGRVFAYDPSHSPSMWLYRSPSSPLYSSAGKTDNEVLLSRSQLQDEFSQAGFTHVATRGAAGITFQYVEGRIARKLLPLYNLYELALRFSPMQNRWGTFLISFASKPA